MSQFAAFSPFELPSFEKVKKGRYQRVGCKELGGGGGGRVEGASGCVRVRGVGMWGVLVGTESFKAVSQKSWIRPQKPASAHKAPGSLGRDSVPRWVAHLRPPKTGFYPLALGRSEPTVAGGRLGEWPRVLFPSPPPEPWHLLPKNKPQTPNPADLNFVSVLWR